MDEVQSETEHYVTTLRVVWIEIRKFLRLRSFGCVTTLRVVWIEMLPFPI